MKKLFEVYRAGKEDEDAECVFMSEKGAINFILDCLDYSKSYAVVSDGRYTAFVRQGKVFRPK